jgi:hypothetical protein
MYGYILFFIIGIVLAVAVCFPVLRSRKKRILELEAKTTESDRDISGFKDKTIKLAAAVRESAGTISFFG